MNMNTPIYENGKTPACHSVLSLVLKIVIQLYTNETILSAKHEDHSLKINFIINSK